MRLGQVRVDATATQRPVIVSMDDRKPIPAETDKTDQVVKHVSAGQNRSDTGKQSFPIPGVDRKSDRVGEVALTYWPTRAEQP
jgi:hypothetical protein